MLEFWRNPEFVRHVRAELRPARLLSAVAVTYVVIILAIMGISQANQSMQDLAKILYAMVASTAGALLVLWNLSSGSQAVAGERELKTFDFLRTTRLTSGELLVGKLLGSPILSYVMYACALVVMIPAGLIGGYSLGAVLLTILLTVASALLLGLFGIWISMMVEKMNRGAGLLFLFFLYPFAFIGMVPGSGEGMLPGFGCLNPLLAISWAHGDFTFSNHHRTGTVPVFGLQLPYAVVTLGLFATIGAWLVLMILRNLKKDMEEVRLLSRWQAIGFAFYINLLFYAFLNLREVVGDHEGARMVTVMGLLLTGATTAVVGLATLSSPERLKIWTRERAGGLEGYLSEDGLPWPWMVVTAAMGFAMLAVQAIALSSNVPLVRFELPHVALGTLLLLAFATRDVLFLQWCRLTRMKGPVMKGILFLMLYYFAASIVLTIAFNVSRTEGMFAARVLTPAFFFEPYEMGAAAAGMMTGVVVQTAVIAVLLGAIHARLHRTLAIARA